MGWKVIAERNYVDTALTSYVLKTVTLTGGEGIATIGDLSSNRTIQLDFSELGEATSPADTDLLCIYNGASFQKVQWTNLPGGTAFPTIVSNTFTKTAHGFSVGKPVYYKDGTDTWMLADADAEATLADGVVASAPDNDTFTVCYAGEMTWSTHGLTQGDQYYLSTTGGNLTTTKPSSSGNWVQAILKPIDANTVLVGVRAAYEIA